MSLHIHDELTTMFMRLQTTILSEFFVKSNFHEIFHYLIVLEFFFSWKQQLTCPCIFMMTTVFVRLQTTILSGFFGSRCTEFTLTLPPADAPIDLKVLIHSVVFTFQTLTVPSDEALINWCPSERKQKNSWN